MKHFEGIGKSDEWYTPRYVFDALSVEFDMDVASPIDRTYICVPAKRFITENSLYTDWNGFVWMNPPFSGKNGKQEWLDKMYVHGNGIALTPDRTSSYWWQRAARQASAILFIDKRIKFIDRFGNEGSMPTNGTNLFAYGNKAIQALYNAEKNKLGIVLKR